MAMLTVIFNPLVGGVLHGLNYSLLGRRELRRFMLSRNLVAGAGLLLLPFFLGGPVSVNGFGASLFFAAYFYKTQEGLFRDHLSKGGEKGSVLIAILWAILITIPVWILAIVSLSVR